MTKLLTATFTLALLLSGCGTSPSPAGVYNARAANAIARPVMPAPLNVQIAHALQPQFPNTLVQVSDVAERDDEPGTYKFSAQIQARNHRTMTIVNGEFDLPSRAVRVIDSSTDAP